MKLRLIAVSVALSCATLSDAQQSGREFDGKVVLFGNLHSHSLLSDDVNRQKGEMPSDGFKAADESGLDFLAITDHHKADDSSHKLQLTPNEYQDDLFEVAMDYNRDHVGEFIAIPGVEWGTTSTGNHLNVFGAPTLLPGSISDIDYRAIYDWAKEHHAQFVQFNHPYSWGNNSDRDDSVGNYGANLYRNKGEFVEDAGPIVRTISVICSVFKGHISGDLKDAENKTHREIHKQAFGEYLAHLDMGFRLSPAANQDTHGSNWGSVTAARTAVWADSFDYDGMMEGVKKNRVYATEDDEMVVAFQVEYDGKRFWMGDTIELKSEEDEVTIVVNVWQLQTDELTDPVNEGPYRVAIWSDPDPTAGSEAEVWDEFKTAADGSKRFRVPVIAGEYIFLQVTETRGKDNLEGDEESATSNSGASGVFTRRRQKNDSAITSPIWFGISADHGI